MSLSGLGLLALTPLALLAYLTAAVQSYAFTQSLSFHCLSWWINKNFELNEFYEILGMVFI